MDRIAFTGHRHLRFSEVQGALAAIHAKYPDATWITGGAIGLDSHAAEYARLHGIPLWLILPFPQKVMTAKWNAAQTAKLRAHIQYCSKLSVLSLVYKASVYQDRNVRMVDLSTLLCAFFDGSPGGTANCVNYAKGKGHPIMMCLSSFSTAKSQHGYREVHGDIFTSDAKAIVNTVNCVGAMGRGIALEFKKRYPDLYVAYRQACARKEIKPGHVWVYRAHDRIILNAAVKDNWRDASRIEWVESCLNELVILCRSMKVTSLALPWMGAMNGWIPVQQIVYSTRRILSNVHEFDISVYEIRDIKIEAPA